MAQPFIGFNKTIFGNNTGMLFGQLLRGDTNVSGGAISRYVGQDEQFPWKRY